MAKSEPTTTTGVTPKAFRWIQATFGTDVVWTSVDCRQVPEVRPHVRPSPVWPPRRRDRSTLERGTTIDGLEVDHAPHRVLTASGGHRVAPHLHCRCGVAKCDRPGPVTVNPRPAGSPVLRCGALRTLRAPALRPCGSDGIFRPTQLAAARGRKIRLQLIHRSPWG